MNDPLLGFIPESVDSYSLDQNLTVVATMLTLGGTSPPGPPAANEIGITVCPAKDGGLWVLYDDTDVTNRSILRKFDPTTGEQLLADVIPSVLGQGVLVGTGLSPTNELVLIGERGAFKCLMDIGCGELLTVNRNTHQLIAVKVENVTDTLSPGTNHSMVLTSLTSTPGGFTATATKLAHGLSTGMFVVIAGADQAEYNGTFFITVIDSQTFTYPFGGSATSPATGTITATEVASTAEIGKVTRYYNLYVDPLDAAVNQAATRLLYIEGDAVKLWDLEQDDFIRTIVAGIGGIGGGGGTPGGGRCTGGTCTGTPDPTLPGWFLTALTTLGATNCVDESLMGTQTMKDACWANGYAIQVNGGCQHRARLYYQGAGVMSRMNACGDFDNGDYSTVVNLVAANHCDWAFL